MQFTLFDRVNNYRKIVRLPSSKKPHDNGCSSFKRIRNACLLANKQCLQSRNVYNSKKELSRFKVG